MAGPNDRAPSVEELDRLAALIRPSWELEDAPFSMGNRSLTPHEWEQLRGETSADSGRTSADPARNSADSARNGEAVRSAVAAGEAPRSAVAAGEARVAIPPQDPPTNGVAAHAAAAAATRASAPSLPARASTPPVFPSARASSPPRAEVARPAPAASTYSASASLAEDFDEPLQKSRKGLYFGIAAAVIVLGGAVFFATRPSEDEPAAPVTSPAESPRNTGANVSNARVDIPPPAPAPPPAATAPPPAAAAPPPAAAAPARSEPAHHPSAPARETATPREAPAREAPAREPAAAREHTTQARGATAPARAPAAAPAPAPKPSNNKGNNQSGGIVRESPF